eukprot:scaffold2735_cov58-Phaeocystis_antarctica.AAC.10
MFGAGRGVRAGGGAAWPRGGGARPVAAVICGADRQAAATKYRATPAGGCCRCRWRAALRRFASPTHLFENNVISCCVLTTAEVKLVKASA